MIGILIGRNDLFMDHDGEIDNGYLRARGGASFSRVKRYLAAWDLGVEMCRKSIANKKIHLNWITKKEILAILKLQP